MKRVGTIFVFQDNVVVVDNTPSTKRNKNTIIIYYITKKGGEC